MAHGSTVLIKVGELIDVPPLRAGQKLNLFAWVCLVIGALTFGLGFIYATPERLWSSYFVSLAFFMGLACGSVILTAIFQVVRAKWSSPISRIAEAGVSFLPWAFLLWACTYFGKEHLYPWARGPMAGREIWMEPNFVYGRFAVLLGLLFFLMRKFVRMSLRGDVGMLREKSKQQGIWGAFSYSSLISGWKGTEAEVAEIQPNRSWHAPLLIALYGLIYSLFVFEMIMAMDSTWYANMFGGFNFIGNIYLAWAFLGIVVTYLMKYYPQYERIVHQDQFHDMGKLTTAFCMLWGYMFWAQFLPQWYGNLPEETQWLILRTREFPWKGFSWVVFPMCFIIPFILLIGRDIKRTPKYFVKICCIIFVGIWLEKYIVIMPQVSPHEIPLGILDIGIFLGFLGGYIMCVKDFLERYPFVQISHPATAGRTDW